MIGKKLFKLNKHYQTKRIGLSKEPTELSISLEPTVHGYLSYSNNRFKSPIDVRIYNLIVHLSIKNRCFLLSVKAKASGHLKIRGMLCINY
jgi:hypothetical protein